MTTWRATVGGVTVQIRLPAAESDCEGFGQGYGAENPDVHSLPSCGTVEVRGVSEGTTGSRTPPYSNRAASWRVYPSMKRPHSPVLAWFGHPATVAATFVLLVNDHLLKALWPGPVTGKLSDVAGLLVAPPVLALAFLPALALTRAGPFSSVLARLAAPVAIVATGVGFTLVKTTEAGAELASRAWTLVAGPSRVLADPTDLVALPALGVAWLVWRGCRSDQAVRRARALVVIPFALIGVTATSAVPPPPTALSVSADDEAITVLIDYGSSSAAVSRDGGRTWSMRPGPVPAPATPSVPPLPATRACLPDDPRHCYRVVPPRLGVDETRDGGANWKTVWKVSEGREDALRRKNDRPYLPPWQGSTAVAVQRVPGGHVVVAANGIDGIAVRDPRGTWRRLGFSADGLSSGAAVPLDALNIDLRVEHNIGLFTGLLAFMVGMTAARRREPQNSGLAAAAYVLAALGFLSVQPSESLIGPLFLLFGSACALTATVLAAAAAIKARVPTWTWIMLSAIAVCIPAVISMTFSGWLSGIPDDYSTAESLAWLVGGAGVGASVLIGWTAARSAEERQVA
ncbi:hypothetical protein [Streptosporangium sp. CA-115845]|uniref:hypothetical protein n=1 Tax=Streptosporangium sp. CA-115845 TaxID=3240071 RepID=UPI003D943847